MLSEVIELLYFAMFHALFEHVHFGIVSAIDGLQPEGVEWGDLALSHRKR